MSKYKIAGTYDAIISLGDRNLISNQLIKNHLKSHSEVFEWMVMPQLSKVNNLLENKFSYIMDNNFQIVGYAGDTKIIVTDNYYEFLSSYDFSTAPRKHLGGYAGILEEYKRRLKHLFSLLDNAKRILFIRTGGSYDEALKLQSVLNQLVKHQFSILLVNHENVKGIVEKKWPLPKVYAVDFPNKDIWESNNVYWRNILKDIKILV